MATKLQCSSRFALLKVEDDDSSDDGGANVKSAKQKTSQQAQGAKKKSKKKKKVEEDREKGELRNLAFGKPGQKNKSQNSNPGCSSSSNATPSSSSHSNGPNNEQWEEWKRVDTEFTMDTYEKELQEAMLLSKLEYQQRLQFMEATKDALDIPTNENTSKEGKKKKKKNVLTLEEFNKRNGAGDSEHTNQTINGGDHRPNTSSNDKVLNTTKPPAMDENKFFSNVEEDASKAIRKEMITEEYRKQYVVENARAAQHQKEMDKRDKEIAMLRASLRNMEDELKQVKKRNKQLCVILAQGEMKDKADVLMQLEDLTAVKDELTEQLTDQSALLEKERSKVHALQKELDKTKGGKHSKA